MTAVLHVLYGLGAAVWVAFALLYGTTRTWWTSGMGRNLIATSAGVTGVVVGFLLDADAVRLVGILAVIAVGVHRIALLARTPKDVRR